MDFVADSVTYQTVNSHYSYLAGKSFGEFEYLLSDLNEPIGEIIPNFHNIEFRLQQLRDAVSEDRAGRVRDGDPDVLRIPGDCEQRPQDEALYRRQDR